MKKSSILKMHIFGGEDCKLKCAQKGWKKRRREMDGYPK